MGSKKEFHNKSDAGAPTPGRRDGPVVKIFEWAVTKRAARRWYCSTADNCCSDSLPQWRRKKKRKGKNNPGRPENNKEREKSRVIYYSRPPSRPGKDVRGWRHHNRFLLRLAYSTFRLHPVRTWPFRSLINIIKHAGRRRQADKQTDGRCAV